MKIVTVAQMRELEARADREHGLTSPILMEHAGRSIAEILRRHLGGDVAGRNVLVLVGPGNNGGDGLVAARHLTEWGAIVTRYHWKTRQLEVTSGPPGPRAPERGLEGAGIAVGGDLAPVATALAQADVVLDALLGTGVSRPMPDDMRALLARVRAERARRPSLLVVAVDLPSGLNADTGAVDPGTIPADLTVTLANPKLGMFFFPGAGYIGQIEVGDIGLPAGMEVDTTTELITTAAVRSRLPLRPLDSHKGTFGKAMICAGSLPYPGSAFLASTAAGRVGAGLVTLAVAARLAPIYAVKLSEATFQLLPDERPVEERADTLLNGLDGYRALLIGPGLGQADETREFVRLVLRGLQRKISSMSSQQEAISATNGRGADEEMHLRLVVDADGLNNLAKMEDWWTLLPAESVLTPHPGEMTRLRHGERVSGGGPDRLEVARESATVWGHIVVLKGACTIVATPDGRAFFNRNANPAMATAGTGDVLAGMIAGFLAQGLTPVDAAVCAVFLHTQAGAVASETFGDAGLLASDLLPAIPQAIRLVKAADSGGNRP
jgi:hydroxyethylthiazole kinase-like uncharacterized protein yjeF